MPTRKLTAREQVFLEHQQRAEELGFTLAEYAAAYDVKVRDLYNGKRQLTQKRAFGTKSPTGVAFVPVQVASQPPPTAHEVVIRLRHSSGWTLECVDWPPAECLSMLLASSSEVSS